MGRQSRKKQDRRALEIAFAERCGVHIRISPELSVSDVRVRDDLARLVVRLGADDYTALIDWECLDIGSAEFTIADLCAIGQVAGYALRLAADGRQRTRDYAIRSLDVAERIERVTEFLAEHEISADAGLLFRLCEVAVHLNRALLAYMQTHTLPDRARADDPDVYLTISQVVEIATVLRGRVETAHHRLAHVGESVGSIPAAAITSARADMLAYRLAAERQYRQLIEVAAASGCVVPAPPEFGNELNDAVKTLTAGMAAVEQDDHVAAHRLAAARLDALALMGRTPEELIEDLQDLLSMTGADTLDLLHTHLTLISHSAVASPDLLLEQVDAALELIESAKPDRRDNLRSRAGTWLAIALAAGARMDPPRAAVLAARLAGAVRSQHPWPPDRTHAWVLPGNPSVALVESKLGVEAIELPTVDVQAVAHQTGGQHAEEYEPSPPFVELRRELSAQFRPLCERLAASSGVVTVHGFAELKHVPFAALTGIGSVLATAPGLALLARRTPLYRPRSTPGGATGRRLAVVDADVWPGTKPKVACNTLWRFDSGVPIDSPEEARCDELLQLIRTHDELIYFGHGVADQFVNSLTCLKLGVLGDGRVVGIPPQVLRSLDLAHIEWALVLACAAGQGNVWIEPDDGIATALTMAGVGCVVAPTWPIEVRAARAFFDRFILRHDRGRLDARTAWADTLAEDPNRFACVALFDS